MQRSAILLIEGVDVGSFSEEEVYHLTEENTGRGKNKSFISVFICLYVCAGGALCVSMNVCVSVRVCVCVCG